MNKTGTFFLGLGIGVTATIITGYVMKPSAGKEKTADEKRKELKDIILKMSGAEKAALVDKMSDPEVEIMYSFFFKQIGINDLLKKAARADAPKVEITAQTTPTVPATPETPATPATPATPEIPVTPLKPGKIEIAKETLTNLLELNNKYKFFKIG